MSEPQLSEYGVVLTHLMEGRGVQSIEELSAKARAKGYDLNPRHLRELVEGTGSRLPASGWGRGVSTALELSREENTALVEALTATIARLGRGEEKRVG